VKAEEKLASGAHASKARSNYPGQETETRADGLQDRLKEKVIDAREDPDCLKRATQARLDSTHEPSRAPNLDDAVKERAVTGSKGSKSNKK